MNRCGIGYEQFVRYLSFMQSRNLLVNDKVRRYVLTPKGQMTLTHAERVFNIMLMPGEKVPTWGVRVPETVV